MGIYRIAEAGCFGVGYLFHTTSLNIINDFIERFFDFLLLQNRLDLRGWLTGCKFVHFDMGCVKYLLDSYPCSAPFIGYGTPSDLHYSTFRAERRKGWRYTPSLGTRTSLCSLPLKSNNPIPSTWCGFPVFPHRKLHSSVSLRIIALL